MSTINIGALEVQITANTTGLTQGIRRTSRALSKSETALKKNGKAWSRWGTAARVAVAASALLAGREVINLSDTFTSLTNKIRIATASTGNFEKTQRDLFDIAQRSRTSLASTVDLYAKMERATRSTGLSQERLLGVTESIGKAFQIGGATAQEATGAIRQLGQALASGALRGDEFNSVAEQAPVIMEAVKLATGKTSGELRELAAQGLITSDILIQSIERYASTIERDFASAQKTFAQKMTEASNNAVTFIGHNEALTGAVSKLGDAAIFLSNHLEKLATTLGVLGTVVTARFLGPMIAAKTASTGLGLASVVATARVAAFGGVATFAGKRVTQLTAATRLASGAMGLLGGPIGILITVAAALATFVDWESKASKQTKETTSAIMKQSLALKDLSLEDAKKRLKEFGKAGVSASLKLLPLKDRLEEIRGLLKSRRFHFGEEMDVTAKSTGDLNRELSKTKDKIAALKKTFKLSAAGSEELELLIDSLEKQGKKLLEFNKNQSDAQKKSAEAKRISKLKSANDTLLGLEAIFASELELEDARHVKSLAKLEEATNAKISLTQAEGAEKQAIINKANEIAIGLDIAHNDKLKKIREGDHLENIERIQKGLMTEQELENSDFDGKVERLLAAKEFFLGTEREWNELFLSVEAEHQQALNDIKEKARQADAAKDKADKLRKLNDAQALASGLLNVAAAFGSKSDKQQKRFRRAQVIVDTAAGVMKAFATAPDIYSAIALSAFVVAKGKQSLDSINGGSSVRSSGGAAPRSTPPPQQAQQNQNNVQRNISIDLQGSALFTSDQVRALIGQINDATGDGVQLNFSG